MENKNKNKKQLVPSITIITMGLVAVTFFINSCIIAVKFIRSK